MPVYDPTPKDDEGTPHPAMAGKSDGRMEVAALLARLAAAEAVCEFLEGEPGQADYIALLTLLGKWRGVKGE